MKRTSLGADYFDRVYSKTDDPWSFRTSSYERGKYAKTLEFLHDARFHRALEVGCSVGILSGHLAKCCDELVSVDINARALASAMRACEAFPNIQFERMQIPEQFPSGPFDLIVLSEVAYYWSDDDLERCKVSIVATAPSGLLELVHFLPPVADYVRDGDAVHEAFLNDSRFAPIRAHRDEQYRIDVLRVRDAQSEVCAA